MARNKRKRRNKKKNKISTAELLANTSLYKSSSSQQQEQDASNPQNTDTLPSQHATNVSRKIPQTKSQNDSLPPNLDKSDVQNFKEHMGDTFHEILTRFSNHTPLEKQRRDAQDQASASDQKPDKEEWESDSDEDDENAYMDDDEDDNAADFTSADVDSDRYKEKIISKLSKTAFKNIARYSVAELKKYTTRPEVVDQHDTNAPDPLLLIHLKSYRNTVPVPKHWSDDRKYLSSKRGYEKPPFELPDFIKDTGVQEIREKYEEKQQSRSAKTKARDRMRAKLSKTDIDYQILHDAFFKYQKKPPLTIHGDIYYEGKEAELQAKQFKPGKLSAALRAALGMPEGAPPPWLIHMQKHGPPPSYPYLKIPGLNAPIPKGAKWGFHPGGWGRPPVDPQGKPLYGDVFGTSGESAKEEDKQHTHWGELRDDEEEEEDYESSSEEEEEAPPQRNRTKGPTKEELAKKKRSEEIRNNMVASVTTDASAAAQRPKQLFTVLKEEHVSSADQDGLLNTQRQYVIPKEYMRQSGPKRPEVSVEHNKTEEELQRDEFMQQKEEQRKEYSATEEEKQVPIQESRKRKRKAKEKEQARKKFKL